MLSALGHKWSRGPLLRLVVRQVAESAGICNWTCLDCLLEIFDQGLQQKLLKKRFPRYGRKGALQQLLFHLSWNGVCNQSKPASEHEATRSYVADSTVVFAARALSTIEVTLISYRLASMPNPATVVGCVTTALSVQLFDDHNACSHSKLCAPVSDTQDFAFIASYLKHVF